MSLVNFVRDDDVLRKVGITDFSVYANDPSSPLQVDIFVESLG